MIDLKLLMNDFEEVAGRLAKRHLEADFLEQARLLAGQYKAKKRESEELQAEQNAKSKLFGQYKKEGKEIDPLKAELDTLKIRLGEILPEVSALEGELESLALIIPNLPDEKTPVGRDEHDNIEIRRVLEPKMFDFRPKEHWELAEQNGWIEFDRGVKLAKSRFSVLRKEGARMSRALISYMLDFNHSRGFEEVVTPVIVNRETLLGTGQLPKFENDLFKISEVIEEEQGGDKGKGHELYLIPTAEVTLTNLYRDEIIPHDELPLLLTAHTPCFRKEAGSAGRDTRGIIRQHQFDKVELVALTKPEESDAIQQKMIDCASDLLSSLGLPHRLVQLCGGDLGFGASNTVDIEVWLPGQNCYREISSISNTRDFQARRAMIRYKDEDKKNRLVHTLNGSSLAVGRTLVAIMENYQNADGTIEIPEVLRRYL